MGVGLVGRLCFEGEILAVGLWFFPEVDDTIFCSFCITL